jgi:cell division protein FtsB
MIAKKEKIKNSRLGDNFMPVLLGCLVFIVVGFLVYSDMKISSLRTERIVKLRELQQQLTDLEAKRQELGAQVSQGESEAYVEKEARETFNLKKPGEEVVAVLPAEGSQEKAPVKGFWQNVVDKIKFW